MDIWYACSCGCIIKHCYIATWQHNNGITGVVYIVVGLASIGQQPPAIYVDIVMCAHIVGAVRHFKMAARKERVNPESSGRVYGVSAEPNP